MSKPVWAIGAGRSGGLGDRFEEPPAATGTAGLWVHVQILQVAGSGRRPRVLMKQVVNESDQDTGRIPSAQAVNSSIVKPLSGDFGDCCGNLHAIKELIFRPQLRPAGAFRAAQRLDTNHAKTPLFE